MRERRDGIATNQCPRVLYCHRNIWLPTLDNERVALQVRIKSLIDYADHEAVVDYKGFGLGWSWHGVEVL